ncbi:hypothetical protein RKD27_005293 [Streptomyces sp. SAI-126]|uniref:eCIS core domain-containing protein n=1 Tax=Streptomyces sp. SAI-126 TaxID=3377732 RepID=UPI003C7A088E
MHEYAQRSLVRKVPGTERVPGRRDLTADASRDIDAVLRSPGIQLDADVRARFSPRVGFDLSHIRIHTDAEAARSAREVDAAAYTVGHHVIFGADRYRPHLLDGQRLLAHELAHVLPRPVPGALLSGRISDPSSEVERRAEQGARPVGGIGPTPGPEPGVLYRQPAGSAGAVDIESFAATASSLTIDRTGTHLTITGTLAATGDAASATSAATVEATIQSYWTQTFSDGYTVTCAVKVVYYPAGSVLPANTNIVDITTWSLRPSRVNLVTGNMTLDTREPDALTWAAAHEFGHLLGLNDRYSLSIMESIRNLRRVTTPDPGYAGNLMAESGGKLESKNLKDIGTENAPSALSKDDRIRSWVTRASRADLRALPTATRTAMLETLLSGWISDEDIAAVEAIVAVTVAGADSAAVKAALEAVLHSAGAGDRARLRLMTNQLP